VTPVTTPQGAASSRRVHTDTLVNLAGFAIPVVASLITVPWYLSAVGEERYGVLVIVWVMLGYFGVFDLGLGRATTHRIAQAADDRERATTVFWTATSLNAVMGIVGGAVLLPIAYVLIERVFKFPVALKQEVVSSLPWLAAAVPLLTISSVFSGALQGRGRFVPVNAVSSLYGVLSQVVPLTVALVHGPSLVWLIASATIVQLSTTLLGLLACFRWVTDVRPRIDRSLVRGLFGFGAWISVTGLFAPLVAIVDRMAVGATLGAAGVTRYSIPFNLAARLWIIPGSLGRSIFPRLAAMGRREAESFAQDAFASLFVLWTPIVIAAVLFVEPFLDVWIGSQLGPSAPRIAAIILVGVWLEGLGFVPSGFLQAQGRPDLPAKLHLLEVVPFLAVLWVGLKVGGVEGGALAWTIRSVADTAIVAALSRIRWRLGADVRTGTVLLALAFGVAMVFPGATMLRVGADAVLVLATAAWGLAAMPETLRSRVATSLRGLAPLGRPRQPVDDSPA
jgi:O-antigen/teichoic acid export membrane protein